MRENNWKTLLCVSRATAPAFVEQIPIFWLISFHLFLGLFPWNIMQFCRAVNKSSSFAFCNWIISITTVAILKYAILGCHVIRFRNSKRSDLRFWEMLRNPWDKNWKTSYGSNNCSKFKVIRPTVFLNVGIIIRTVLNTIGLLTPFRRYN